MKLSFLKLRRIIKEEVQKLTEVRSSGVLYHFTHGARLSLILGDNALKVSYGEKRNPNTGERELGVSFTRTKKVGKGVLPFAKDRSIRLVFDRDKLNQDYEIVPRANTGGRDEREETVMAEEIKPVKKYIDRIDVSLKNLVENDLSKIRFGQPLDFVSSEIDEPKDVLPSEVSEKMEDPPFSKIKKLFDRHYTKKYNVPFNLVKGDFNF